MTKRMLFYVFIEVIFASCCCMPGTTAAQRKTAKAINVATNKNIELFGLMIQLDNGKALEQNNDSAIIEGKKTAWKDWYAATLINYNRFKAFDNDTAIRFYRTLGERGISDDFIIGLLVQCTNVPNAKLTAATDKSLLAGLSRNGIYAEGVADMDAFLKLINNFSKTIKFDNYLLEHKKDYSTIKGDVKRNVPANLISVMEGFYQKRFSSYYLIPSLHLFPTTGFGKMQHSTNTIYNFFGALGMQSFKSNPPVLAFDDRTKLLGLTVHEFGHSFVNPAVDKVSKEVIEKTKYLYEPIKSGMTSKGYISWNICLNEHFVRAGEILIARQLGDEARANQILEDNIREHFSYLPQIVKQLEIYSEHKSKYKYYDDYIASVIENLKPIALAGQGD